MPLPKISTPTYELDLPSTGETIQYRPFLVREEKQARRTILVCEQSSALRVGMLAQQLREEHPDQVRRGVCQKDVGGRGHKMTIDGRCSLLRASQICARRKELGE